MGVLRALASGLLGVGDMTAETIARQAGKGIRRAAAPTAAAGGTAAMMKKHERKMDEERGQEKSAFWEGFHKSAAVFSIPHGTEKGVAHTQEMLRKLVRGGKPKS